MTGEAKIDCWCPPSRMACKSDVECEQPSLGHQQCGPFVRRPYGNTLVMRRSVEGKLSASSRNPQHKLPWSAVDSKAVLGSPDHHFIISSIAGSSPE